MGGDVHAVRGRLTKGREVTTQVRPAMADALSCTHRDEREGEDIKSREPVLFFSGSLPFSHLHRCRVAADLDERSLGLVVRRELADIHGHGAKHRRLKAAPQAADALLARHLQGGQSRVNEWGERLLRITTFA